MPHGTEVGLGPGDIVLDGSHPPPKKRWHSSPQFSVHVYYGQTALCIRIPLGTEVDLSLGDIELDGDAAPPDKRTTYPIFSPCLLWQNVSMDQDATGYGGRPLPRRHCVRGDPASLP